MGRRNRLFAAGVQGGEAPSTIHTLVESCKIAGVEPLAYLTDMLSISVV